MIVQRNSDLLGESGERKQLALYLVWQSATQSRCVTQSLLPQWLLPDERGRVKQEIRNYSDYLEYDMKNRVHDWKLIEACAIRIHTGKF